LCPKYVTKKTPAPYREWLQAIKDSLDEQVDETQYTHPAIQKVFDAIEKDLVTPQERARMFDEYNQETKKHEVFQEGEAKGRKEGKEEGRKEGKAEGRKEGKAEGRKEGEEKGRLEALQEAARNFLSLGVLTVAQVAQATGLTVAQVKALAR
jgi:predicted transposase YdaD